MTLAQDRLATPREVCAFLRISLTRLYQLVNADELHGVRVGSQWRFLPDDVQAYVAQEAKPPGEPRP